MIKCATCGANNLNNADLCSQCGVQLLHGTPSRMTASPAGTHALIPGAALRGGDYIIDKVLGQGGFGITYLASEPRLQRWVAIKEFFLTGTCSRQGNAVHPITGVLTASDFSQSRTSFLEEGQKLARFHHPGIVGVYSIFEENNTAYIVMEYLNGRSLQSIIDSQGRLPVQDAIDHLRSIAGALETVHQANLLHLDIKPDNIMVCDDGRAVLIDFGISRDFSVRHTVTNQGFCTPGFAPLEQYGQKVRSKPSTDVYALAATFYCALTGEVPVAAPDRTSGVDMKPPSRLNPQVPASVDRAIMWAMEMADSRRPQTVHDFWEEVIGSAKPQHSASTSGVQTSPVVAGPFRFASGDTAHNAEELVRLLDRNWEQAKTYLETGAIASWLKLVGRTDWANAASTSIKGSSSTDVALEAFIQSTKLLPYPQPEATPNPLDLGSIQVQRKGCSRELEIRNVGRGYLTARVDSDSAWMSVSPERVSGNSATVDVTVDTQSVPIGQAYTKNVSIKTDGGPPLIVPVKFRIIHSWWTLTKLVTKISAVLAAVVGLLILYRVFVHDSSFAAIETGATGSWGRSAVFSPRGDIVAFVRNGDAELWNITERKLVKRLRQQWPVALSADNAHAVTIASDRKTIRLLDITKGELLQAFSLSPSKPSGNAISPDGRLIAASDGSRVMLGAQRMRRMRQMSPHNRYSDEWDVSVVFSPDSRYLAGQLELGRNVACLWSVQTGRLQKTFYPAFGPLVFSSDGRLLASLQCIFDVKSGRLIRKLRRGSILCFAPDSRTLASDVGGGNISLIDVGTGTEVRLIRSRLRHISAAAFNMQGNVLAAANDHTVKLWRVK